VTARIVIAVDPDTVGGEPNHAGAICLDGVLRWCGRLTPDVRLPSVSAVDLALAEVHIERPHLRGRRGERTPNPKTIVDLTWHAGVLAGAFEAQGMRVTTHLPHEWKGTAKKVQHHMRLLRVLTPPEESLLPTSRGKTARQAVEDAARKFGVTGREVYDWQGGDILDAVALAMTVVGRLSK